MSLNKVCLIGHLGNDPDLKSTPTGAQVATFSLATNERWKDKEGKAQEHTEWHRVVVWGKTAENVAKYCQKGKQVYVEGSLRTRTWEDKDKVKRYTTEINAQAVQFLQGGGGQKGPPHPSEAAGSMATNTEGNGSGGIPEDDIPF